MQNTPDTVILLHGILRSNKCMNKIEKCLQKNGYKTVNISYPSKTKTIENLANDFLADKLSSLPTTGKIHFVTHSLGGLLVHAYLEKHEIKNIGRVVMLSPPHNGSEIVDFFKRHPVINIIFKNIFGPAGQQLGTNMDPDQFKIYKQENFSFDLGIISGSKVINPAGYVLINKPSDGTVSVESTKIKGMNDHITMPVDHLFMVKDKDVISQSLYFIQNGMFLE